jgi:hypothetical protein
MVKCGGLRNYTSEIGGPLRLLVGSVVGMWVGLKRRVSIVSSSPRRMGGCVGFTNRLSSGV